MTANSAPVARLSGAAPSPDYSEDLSGPNSTRPSLRVNFGWTFAGNAVYAACQWAILAVIARLADPEAVGRFALGLAVTAPTFMLCGLQLRGVQATDAADQYRFSDYLGVRIVGMAAALGVSAAVVATSGFGVQTSTVVLAVALSKAVEGLCDVHYGVLQRHELMRSIATSLAMRGILSVTTVAVLLWFGGGLVAAVVALAASWATVLVVHDIRAVRAALGDERSSSVPRFRPRTIGRIVLLAGPLGLAMMLISLRTNVPRYVLERNVGVGDLGIFAALASLVVAGNFVISALGQSASPRLARHLHDGHVDAFRHLLGRLLLLGAALGVSGVILAASVGTPILRLLFGAAYAARSDVLVWLMAAGGVGFCNSFLGYAATAARRFRVQFPLFASTVGVALGGSLWLVPRYGLTGAAWAWGLAVLLECLALGAVVLSVLHGSRPRAVS